MRVGRWVGGGQRRKFESLCRAGKVCGKVRVDAFQSSIRRAMEISSSKCIRRRSFLFFFFFGGIDRDGGEFLMIVVCVNV